VQYQNTGKVLLEKFGFTTKNVYQKAAALLGKGFLALEYPRVCYLDALALQQPCERLSTV